MKLYHYTIGHKMPDILKTALLNTSPIKPNFREIPLVWLSSNAKFENSARKLMIKAGNEFIMTLEDMITYGGGIFRFAFDSEQIEIQDWQYIRNKTGLSSQIRRRMLKRAKQVNAEHDEWYGYVGKPLPIENATIEHCTELDEDGNPIWVEFSIESLPESNPSLLSTTYNEACKYMPTSNLDTAWANA